MTPIDIRPANSLSGRKVEAITTTKQPDNPLAIPPQLASIEQMRKFPHRIGIIFDDSGSMCGERITAAHQACEIFLKHCNSTDTAVFVVPMNEALISATNDHFSLNLLISKIMDTGGTPLYGSMRKALDYERPNFITRAVLFSDGSPSDSDVGIIQSYVEKKISVDTVYIGGRDNSDNSVLQNISERTGGVYMKFSDMEKMKAAFKYLSPGYRGLLADKSFVENLQK
jgi:uncharacterized protein YegL